MRTSSAAARLSDSILTNSSASDRLFALILAAYALSNCSVLALLLAMDLALTYSSLAALLYALTQMVTFWALILSLYLTANLSILALPPPDFDRVRRIRILFLFAVRRPIPSMYLHPLSQGL